MTLKIQTLESVGSFLLELQKWLTPGQQDFPGDAAAGKALTEEGLGARDLAQLFCRCLACAGRWGGLKGP